MRPLASILALLFLIIATAQAFAKEGTSTESSPAAQTSVTETPISTDSTGTPPTSPKPDAEQTDEAAKQTDEAAKAQEAKAEEARKLEEAAKKAAEKKTRDADYAKGSQLFQAKKYSDAIKVLQKAGNSTADDGEAKILLGYCYYALKQYPTALKQYQLAADKGTLVSVRNRAQKLAQTLNCYMRGICPGNCLKPSMPGWRKMNVPGKPDYLVWMVYPYLDPAGKGGSEYWSNDHMGEVIEYVNGRPINKGKCPICGGTGKVSLAK